MQDWKMRHHQNEVAYEQSACQNWTTRGLDIRPLRSKVDGAYYGVFVSQQLLPLTSWVSGEFIFQQGSAPACSHATFLTLIFQKEGQRSVPVKVFIESFKILSTRGYGKSIIW